MKKTLFVIFIVLLILAVLAATVFLICRHFQNQTLDKNGMENPNPVPEIEPEDPGAIEMLDGDYTYVANDILMPVLSGTWESADGTYTITLTEEYQILVTRSGETILEGDYTFSYLQPGEVFSTDLYLPNTALTLPDGTVIERLYHEVSDSDENGRIIMTLMRGISDTEEIIFKKQ